MTVPRAWSPRALARGVAPLVVWSPRALARGASVVCALVLLAVSISSAQGGGAAAAGPVVVLETAKGTIEIQMYQSESPKSVDKILALVKRGFYRGQRIHRVERSLVQFGDPASRDVSRKDWWGRTSSGTAVGVAEFNRHLNVRGAVGLAHGGDARYADSQIYILKTASPSLNKVHVVIGQVTKGMDVVDKLQIADVIKNVTIR